jgi:hypothetical protein
MLSLVIEIRSDSVEGSLVHFPNKDILYGASVPLPQKDESNDESLTVTMLKKLSELCVHISRERSKFTSDQIAEVHYVLSSPWIVSEAKTVHFEHEKEAEVTEATIKKILDDHKKEFVKQYESGMTFVEQKIFSIELNGYPVSDYKGKRAKTLRVAFIHSMSPTKLVKDIDAVVGRALHVHKESYHSSVFLQYLATRIQLGENKEYILVHVHGELTEVIVVKKGSDVYLGSFPFGVATLTRKVSLELGGTLGAADSALTLFEEKKLEEGQHGQVRDVICKLLQEWQTDCAQALSGVGEGVLMPRTIYLSTETGHSIFWKAALEELDYEVVVDDAPITKLYMTALLSML